MAIADSSTPPARPFVRVALIVLGAIVTLRALTDLPAAFHDYGHTDPLVIFAQRVTTARLVIVPFVAGAALVLAVIGRLRHAIVLFAATILVDWAAELPSIPIHGLELAASVPGLFRFAQLCVYPLIAIAAIVLALRNARLPLATALVAVPTVLGFLGVVMFAVGVAIYGF